MASTVDSVLSIGDIFEIYGVRSSSRTKTTAPANSVGAVTFKDAGVIIRNALLAAEAIVGHLGDVADALALAENDGILLGTDASRVNLQAATRRSAERIDAAVMAAAFRGFNLVAGGEANLRIETRSLGGTVSVPRQPLDSATLGIGDLDFISDEGLLEAATTVAAARARAAASLIFLRALDSAGPGFDTFIRQLAAAAGEIQAESLPRGSIINVVG